MATVLNILSSLALLGMVFLMYAIVSANTIDRDDD